MDKGLFLLFPFSFLAVSLIFTFLLYSERSFCLKIELPHWTWRNPSLCLVPLKVSSFLHTTQIKALGIANLQYSLQSRFIEAVVASRSRDTDICIDTADGRFRESRKQHVSKYEHGDVSTKAAQEGYG